MEQNIRDLVEQVNYYIESSKKEKGYTLALEKESKKKYIVSKYTPLKEAKELIGEDLGNKNTIWIFFGFGLGYAIEEVLARCGSETKIIVIEPSEDLLDAQLKISHQAELFKKENIKLYAGCDLGKIKQLFEDNIPSKEINNFKVITRVGYLEYYSEYYKEVTKTLDEVTTNVIVQFNTVKRFGEVFLRNILRNRYALRNRCDLSVHKNQYKNIPALVVSGGPSLSKNIHLIKQFKGLIFTGGRTLTPIREQGIEPDFLVSIDPQDITFDTLRENADNDLPLITLDRGNDKVVAANSGPKYFIMGEEVTNDILGIKPSEIISQGGSVATVCVSAAQYMGCNPIIFIGQDLAYTNMKFHAEECSDTKIFGTENQVDKKTDCISEGYKEVASVEGGKVWTTPVLITYLRWMEQFIELCPEVEFINATEGGALMAGAVNETFEEVINKYQQIEKPKLKHIKAEEQIIDVDKNIGETIKVLTKLRQSVQKAENLAKNLVYEYSQYKGLRKNKINELLRGLERLDQEIMNIPSKKNIVTYLFDTAYTELERNKKYKPQIKGNKLEEEENIAQYSAMVYGTLSEVILQVVELFQEEMSQDESR